MVHNFFDTFGGAIKKESMQNEELAKELQKPVIKKYTHLFTDKY